MSTRAGLRRTPSPGKDAWYAPSATGSSGIGHLHPSHCCRWRDRLRLVKAVLGTARRRRSLLGVARTRTPVGRGSLGSIELLP